ncbi:MAG: hypothetical protein HGA54_01195, partial [Actinobacteria bacterium]|nr:hypothetical protein [Actinomycetota bacterium]
MGREVAREGDFICHDGSRESWRLRVSSRARYERITYSAREGLIVTLPSRSRRNPERILEGNRTQVEHMIMRMRPHRDTFVESLCAPLPRKLEFLTAGEIWDVRYEERDSSRVTTRV